MPTFSPEDRELLSKYVTDPEGDIYAVHGLPNMVGAVYARYSRAAGGFRETLLKEFVREGAVDPAKADALIQRVLIAFGDDSVCELEPAHLSFERISILATKEIEDRRIGGSPIEQSTRYVFYDQKDADGTWRYYRDPEVMASVHGAKYVETMDFLFETYARLAEPLQAYYRGVKPIEDAEYDVNGDGAKEKYADLADEKLRKAFETTYKVDIRTKACDTLRALLPLSTRTNVGVMGNGRFFETVIRHCLSSDYPEVREIAGAAHRELSKVIPRYVQRAKQNDYAMRVRGAMDALASELFANIAPAQVTGEGGVDLLGRGQAHIAAACAVAPGDADVAAKALQDEEDNLTLATMLYPHLRHPLRQVRDEVRKMSRETKDRVIAAYIGERATRRDRPGRALETGYPYTFDFCTDFGTYKDLQRHRMGTQLRQAFTPALGFVMPADLVAAGFEKDAQECADRALALYEALRQDFPRQASYATLHGSLVHWSLAMNDRAVMHLIELRTTPQGHPSYRKVGQLMHKAIARRSAWRGAAIQFVDYGDYAWARGDAEAKQRVKEMALEAKT
jgi:thymidylate synthase ThyX